jgi:cysteine synthase
MKGAIAKANELKESLNGKGVILMQFDNSDNPKVHRYDQVYVIYPFFTLTPFLPFTQLR